MTNKFYIQNTRSYVGNSMRWWRFNDSDYVCDIQKARVFAKTAAEKLCKLSSYLKMWPKEFIDGHVEHHVNRKNMRIIEDGKVKRGFKS